MFGGISSVFSNKDTPPANQVSPPSENVDTVSSTPTSNMSSITEKGGNLVLLHLGL